MPIPDASEATIHPCDVKCLKRGDNGLAFQTRYKALRWRPSES